MAANGYAQKGQHYPPGHWGKWRGVTCSEAGCDKAAKCRGYCNTHYNKARWASGVRPPSVNPISRRAARIKYRYRVTAEEYDTRCAAQDGKCAICGQPPGANVRAHWGGKLCVDHDHASGTIRGLLCNDCNLVVGYGKTPDVLLRAAQYLCDHQ